MKNRRYFLIQGTLATAAMIALKPLTSIGSTISKVTGFDESFSKLAFIHTASWNGNDDKTIQYIRDMKKNSRNMILLNAGQTKPSETGSLTYDASFNGRDDLFTTQAKYTIITKGNTKIGVISAKEDEKDIIQKIRTLSTRLKKEKNCALVVCLSQLGYRNKKGADDLKLAKETTDLDIIIGGHQQNFHLHPIVALNSNNAEVIIHAAAGNSLALGKIEIDFDELGRKHQISFADHRSESCILKKSIEEAA